MHINKTQSLKLNSWGVPSVVCDHISIFTTKLTSMLLCWRLQASHTWLRVYLSCKVYSAADATVKIDQSFTRNYSRLCLSWTPVSERKTPTHARKQHFSSLTRSLQLLLRRPINSGCSGLRAAGTGLVLSAVKIKQKNNKVDHLGRACLCVCDRQQTCGHLSSICEHLWGLTLVCWLLSARFPAGNCLFLTEETNGDVVRGRFTVVICFHAGNLKSCAIYDSLHN